MSTFSKVSQDRLNECHQDLQTIFNEVVKNYDCAVLVGHRNKEDQERAFQQKKSKLQYPDSQHNSTPSMAADVSPCPIDWSDFKKFYHFAGYVLGISTKLKSEGKIIHSLRWGGDWKRNLNFKENKFNDLPHFELIAE